MFADRYTEPTAYEKENYEVALSDGYGRDPEPGITASYSAKR